MNNGVVGGESVGPRLPVMSNRQNYQIHSSARDSMRQLVSYGIMMMTHRLVTAITISVRIHFLGEKTQDCGGITDFEI